MVLPLGKRALVMKIFEGAKLFRLRKSNSSRSQVRVESSLQLQVVCGRLRRHHAIYVPIERKTVFVVDHPDSSHYYSFCYDNYFRSASWIENLLPWLPYRLFSKWVCDCSQSMMPNRRTLVDLNLDDSETHTKASSIGEELERCVGRRLAHGSS